MLELEKHASTSLNICLHCSNSDNASDQTVAVSSKSQACLNLKPERSLLEMKIYKTNKILNSLRSCIESNTVFYSLVVNRKRLLSLITDLPEMSKLDRLTV